LGGVSWYQAASPVVSLIMSGDGRLRRRSHVLLSVLGVLGVVVADVLATYNGDMLLRTYPKTQGDRDFLDGIATSDIRQYADMWGLPKADDVPVYVYVKVGGFRVTEEAFINQNLTFEPLIEDWQRLIDNEKEELAKRKLNFSVSDSGFDFETYHTYEEVVTFLKEEEEKNPSQINVTSLGKTHEGRDILLAKVSKSGAFGDNPVVYINCATHAREWISTAVCTWMIRQLTTDPQNSALLDKYDWWFVPIANPDGYSYSWTRDRMWRKSRSPGPSSCFGVDLNRNFDVGFNNTVRDSCSSSYGGSAPFSEIETQTVRDLLSANAGRVKAALFLHSFSQLWLSPYGVNADEPKDYKEMEKVMKAGVEALKSTYNTTFTYGSIANVLYPAPGCAIDYTYQDLGIVYSFLIELRDRGFHAFILPIEQILPTAIETMNGIRAMINAMPSP